MTETESRTRIKFSWLGNAEVACGSPVVFSVSQRKYLMRSIAGEAIAIPFKQVRKLHGMASALPSVVTLVP